MVGTTVGSYKILEKIRDGGAGSVFKAQGPRGESVVIKMISEAWNEQKDRRKAFKRESETTQRMVHPGVIRVFSYSDGPPRPYIVMEYFPSDNLKAVLWHKQHILDGRKMAILKQCAEALHYVHSQGVVHRDVKPENFLVNEEGSVRLIDFSIAQTKADRSFFSFGKKVDGTPLYMSPEQIRNETQDARSDMYSFGVMMFELMTRRPPFIGASVDSILEKHLKSAPPSMRGIVKDLSEELDGLVTKLLQKKPGDRLADMSFVIATLNRLAKREEEARSSDFPSRGPSRVVDAVGRPGTSAVPAARPTGSRPTPSPVPAVQPPGSRPTPGAVPAVGAGAVKPPSSTAIPSVAAGAAKPPSSTALPPVAASAGGASAAGATPPLAVPPAKDTTTRTPTKAAIPGAANPVTRTQTKPGVPSATGSGTKTATKSGVPSTGKVAAPPPGGPTDGQVPAARPTSSSPTPRMKPSPLRPATADASTATGPPAPDPAPPATTPAPAQEAKEGKA